MWRKSASTTRIARTPRNTATITTRARPTRSLGTERRSRRKITVTGPADFTINSVGTKTSDTVKDGRRTVVWESDHPVSFFNVIAGRWEVERGEGTAVYYHPGHPYNIAEMREGLDAARRYYSRVVLRLSLARAQAERVSQPGHLRPGVSHEHHVFRGDRFLDAEQSGNPRRFRDHRATRPPTSGGAIS